MTNYMFLTYATGSPDHRVQMVDSYGRATPTNRLDLQHLMGKLGNPSQIIEADGSLSKSKAYELAKFAARKFGLPVITDQDNLAHMEAVNIETSKYKKKIVTAIRKLPIPQDLKNHLLKNAADSIEHWRSIKQEYPV